VLLVVIAIIAVLAGLLLPVLSSAKLKSRQIKCMSNMRQWGLGMTMYMDSRRDEFPYEGNFSSAIDQGKNREAWYNSVAQFVNQPKMSTLYDAGSAPRPRDGSLYSCPEAEKRSYEINPTPTNPYFMCGFNNRMDPNDTVSGQNNNSFTRDQVQHPVLTVMFTEDSEGRLPSVSGRLTTGRHRNVANLVFVDGHAELVETNRFRRTAQADQDSSDEWSVPRDVYWYPYKGAPK